MGNLLPAPSGCWLVAYSCTGNDSSSSQSILAVLLCECLLGFPRFLPNLDSTVLLLQLHVFSVLTALCRSSIHAALLASGTGQPLCRNTCLRLCLQGGFSSDFSKASRAFPGAGTTKELVFLNSARLLESSKTVRPHVVLVPCWPLQHSKNSV